MLVAATTVRFASREDLIIHTVIATRPRDLEDVQSILLKRPLLDVAYIREWLSQFADVTDEPLVERFDGLLRAAERSLSYAGHA